MVSEAHGLLAPSLKYDRRTLQRKDTQFILEAERKGKTQKVEGSGEWYTLQKHAICPVTYFLFWAPSAVDFY